MSTDRVWALIWFHMVQSGDLEEMGNNTATYDKGKEAAVGLAGFDFNRMLARGFQKLLRDIDISKE